MNLSILSTQELINYLHSGAVDSLPADIVLSIIESYEKRIEDLKEDIHPEGLTDYDQGWDDAVEEMMGKLRNM